MVEVFRLAGVAPLAPGVGFRIEGSGFGFRLQVSGFRVQGFGFQVSGLFTPQRSRTLPCTAQSTSCWSCSPPSLLASPRSPGNEAGSYLRLIDSCITQHKAQGPSRTCHESKEEEEGRLVRAKSVGFWVQG